MQFRAITLVLAYTAGLMASPLMERTMTKTNVVTPNNYVEHFSEPAKSSNGTLIYLGPPMDRPKTARSKSNRIKQRDCTAYQKPVCSTKYTARNDVCDQLVTELQGDSSISVPGNPRQICYLGSSETSAYCCVSWHNPVYNLNKGDLYSFAYSIFTTCTTDGNSGKVGPVSLEKTCTYVCLSNRGTGC